FQADDGIRYFHVTGVQTCALPISEELEMRSVNNATQALQGLAPNLNIDVNATGGAADAGMNINIRGTGSLSSSSPYILINGVRRSEEHTSELQSRENLVCRLQLAK